jgi:hypothetical protein
MRAEHRDPITAPTPCRGHFTFKSWQLGSSSFPGIPFEFQHGIPLAHLGHMAISEPIKMFRRGSCSDWAGLGDMSIAEAKKKEKRDHPIQAT